MRGFRYAIVSVLPVIRPQIDVRVVKRNGRGSR